MEVVHQTDDFLIIYKKPGVYSHPNNENHHVEAISEMIKPWVDQESFTLPDFQLRKGIVNRLGIVHRLDQDTSGLMVIARNQTCALIFKWLFQNRRVTKKYQAIIDGNFYQSTTFQDYLTRDPQHRNRRKIVDLERYEGQDTIREAILKARPVEIFTQYSCTLVEVTLITGRTHQIRVQFAHRKLPIIGDRLYNRRSHGYRSNGGNRRHKGNRENKRNFLQTESGKMYLCATELNFPSPDLLNPYYDRYPELFTSQKFSDQPTRELVKVKKEILEKLTDHELLHFKIDPPDFFQEQLELLRKKK